MANSTNNLFNKEDSFWQSGPENLKKSRPKKFVKSIKINFTKKIIGQIPFFAISKMAKNQILNWEKSSKLPKMQFHKKN